MNPAARTASPFLSVALPLGRVAAHSGLSLSFSRNASRVFAVKHGDGRAAQGHAAGSHGARLPFAFKDWATETTDHPREIIEATLAHIVGDKVEAAYRRGDALEKRRALMRDWAAFACGCPPTADRALAPNGPLLHTPGHGDAQRIEG